VEDKNIPNLTSASIPGTQSALMDCCYVISTFAVIPEYMLPFRRLCYLLGLLTAMSEFVLSSGDEMLTSLSVTFCRPSFNNLTLH
jgi:hypothetical protein